MSKPCTSHPTRCLKYGCATAHERVNDKPSWEIIRCKISLSERSIGELREYQAPEQSARSASEPLVNRDNRPVVLLNLLFLERHLGDQANIEMLFNRHCAVTHFGTNEEHLWKFVKYKSD